MKISASRISCCRSCSRLTICAWIDTSSADTGSSQTTSFGLQDQRARDADALALAARELVRVAVHLRLGQADARHHRPSRAPAPRPATARGSCVRSGSATICATFMRGFSDASGSWKIIWTSRRSFCQAARRGAAHRPGPSRRSRRRCAGIRFRQRARQRRLAAAGFADDAQRLARVQVEAHAVDGLQRALRAPRAGRCRPRTLKCTCRSRTESSGEASSRAISGGSSAIERASCGVRWQARSTCVVVGSAAAAGARRAALLGAARSAR